MYIDQSAAMYTSYASCLGGPASRPSMTSQFVSGGSDDEEHTSTLTKITSSHAPEDRRASAGNPAPQLVPRSRPAAAQPSIFCTVSVILISLLSLSCHIAEP
jgi:hypothetical protein